MQTRIVFTPTHTTELHKRRTKKDALDLLSMTAHIHKCTAIHMNIAEPILWDNIYVTTLSECNIRNFDEENKKKVGKKDEKNKRVSV